jgi:Zn-dependent peptidase ImmA (M78 family)
VVYSNIVDAVRQVLRGCESRDPFEVCRRLGIILVPTSFGAEPTSIKGFFLEHRRVRTILYNCDLPPIIQRIIVAHELGHAVLHRNSSHNFTDIGLYDESSICEKEANMFSAEFLLGDAEVINVLNNDCTFFAAAAMLMVPVELLDFKFRMMKKKGCHVTVSPIMAKNNFLRDIEIPACCDDYES